MLAAKKLALEQQQIKAAAEIASNAGARVGVSERLPTVTASKKLLSPAEVLSVGEAIAREGEEREQKERRKKELEEARETERIRLSNILQKEQLEQLG